MEKTINEMLEQKISELCAGNEETRNKVEEILSLQRQIDVKPAEILIETSEVKERYPISGAMEILKCDNKIAFHTPYFWAIAMPSLANNMKGGALYETLDWLCDYRKNEAEYSGEDKKNRDIWSDVIVSLMALPLDVFTNMDYTLDVANMIMERRIAYYNSVIEEAKAVEAETMEEIQKNLMFEATIEEEQNLIEKSVKGKKVRKHEKAV